MCCIPNYIALISLRSTLEVYDFFFGDVHDKKFATLPCFSILKNRLFILPPVVNLSILKPFVTTFIESSKFEPGKENSIFYFPLLIGFQIIRVGVYVIFLELILNPEFNSMLLLRWFFYYSMLMVDRLFDDHTYLLSFNETLKFLFINLIFAFRDANYIYFILKSFNITPFTIK